VKEREREKEYKYNIETNTRIADKKDKFDENEFRYY
jgi:hypothetical protein